MVNTFLIDSDYTISSKHLDSKRLNKQITEAIQILENLIDLYTVADYFGWELPFSFDEENSFDSETIAKLFVERSDWVKATLKKYNKLNVYLRYYSIDRKSDKINKVYAYTYNNIALCPELQIVEISKESSQDIITLYNNEKFTISNNKVEYFKIENKEKKRYEVSRERVCLRKKDEKIVTFTGYANHAIIRMWIGYEDSLKLYINAHLQAWLSGVNKSGKPRQSMRKPFTTITGGELNELYVNHPWWKEFKYLHYAHRSSLYRKEVARNEPIFYKGNSMFKIMKNNDTLTVRRGIPKKFLEYGYIWTAGSKDKDLTFPEIALLVKCTRNEMNYNTINLNCVCSKITSDDKPTRVGNKNSLTKPKLKKK
jgi:hypothetical protein